MEQWKMCRSRGLRVVVNKPVGSAEHVGWIRADEVEDLLLGLNVFLNVLEDALQSQRLRVAQSSSAQSSEPSL